MELIRQIKRNKDYYAILGVEKTCSVEEIRKAYKKLSLKVHPDKNKAPGSEEAFKKVSKAFKCLSDDTSRRQYDQTGLVDQFEARLFLHKNYSYQIPKTTEKLGVEFFVKSVAFDDNFPIGSPARANIEDNNNLFTVFKSLYLKTPELLDAKICHQSRIVALIRILPVHVVAFINRYMLCTKVDEYDSRITLKKAAAVARSIANIAASTPASSQKVAIVKNIPRHHIQTQVISHRQPKVALPALSKAVSVFTL
ncbi:hypothetical protein GH714_029199 [Hevea brasiliensis]|uniref:J domain-containing protein n=1 Tax=Hevea brasiliensis TaxID=3981 RepID=A0A6A6KLG9_HEVBR|nr:hypothetical protein GH714_029199 [Hevea brasiliensis]